MTSLQKPPRIALWVAMLDGNAYPYEAKEALGIDDLWMVDGLSDVMPGSNMDGSLLRPDRTMKLIRITDLAAFERWVRRNLSADHQRELSAAIVLKGVSV